MIDTIRTGVPDGLDELAQLGRTLQLRNLTHYRVRSLPHCGNLTHVIAL